MSKREDFSEQRSAGAERLSTVADGRPDYALLELIEQYRLFEVPMSHQDSRSCLSQRLNRPTSDFARLFQGNRPDSGLQQCCSALLLEKQLTRDSTFV